MAEHTLPIPEPKRSSAPWRPRGSRLEVRNPEPGYRYKWASVAAGSEIDRIDELMEEGYVPATRVAGGGKGKEGEASLTSMPKVGTLRLMKIPEELVEQRAAYFQDQTDRQTMRPAQRAVQLLNHAGGPYNPEGVITEELINPVTGRPFEDPAQARLFMAQKIRTQRYPTMARRSRPFGG